VAVDDGEVVEHRPAAGDEARSMSERADGSIARAYEKLRDARRLWAEVDRAEAEAQTRIIKATRDAADAERTLKNLTISLEALLQAVRARQMEVAAASDAYLGDANRAVQYAHERTKALQQDIADDVARLQARSEDVLATLDRRDKECRRVEMDVLREADDALRRVAMDRDYLSEQVRELERSAKEIAEKVKP
jgi:hypothetical protein